MPDAMVLVSVKFLHLFACIEALILILFALFQVHHGFYNAYHNTTIRPGILNAVARAKEFYGDLGIIVTGHSMGGAMASFCALDLRVIIIRN